MKFLRHRHLFPILIGSLAMASAARADLTGCIINANGLWLGPASAVVGSETEFTAIDDTVFFDFSSDSLTVSLNPSRFADWMGETTTWAMFENGTYVFSGFTDTILHCWIAENVGFSGSIVDVFSFTDHSITVSVSSFKAMTGTEQIYLDNKLVFRIDAAARPVPEHGSTLAFLGAALLTVCLLRRRRAV